MARKEAIAYRESAINEEPREIDEAVEAIEPPVEHHLLHQDVHVEEAVEAIKPIVTVNNQGNEKECIYIPRVFPGKRYRLKALFADTNLGTFPGKDLQYGAVMVSLPPFGQELIELSR